MIRQRTTVNEIAPYVQGAAPLTSQSYKLSSNENPFPPLPSVLEAVRAAAESIQLYPQMDAKELRAGIGRSLGVDPEHVAVGAGSVEVASQLIHALAGTGDEVVFAWRSFEAYPLLVRVAGATPVPVPLTADGRHDLPAMLRAITSHTRLIFICNPNNPTGTVVTHAELTAFMEHVPDDVLVVIDEAYVHFDRDPDSPDGLEFYRAYPNVAVLHTFSKAHGLAGLRIGYAVAPPDVTVNLRKVSLPFAVTALAQQAALASLAAGAELAERIDHVVTARESLASAVEEWGIPVARSQGNFLWLPAGDDTRRILDALSEQGVSVRDWPGEGTRITVGDDAANARVLTALDSVLTIAK
ncbi:histidinol-phosphate transaminase [Kitasatospora sp. NPDC001574]